LRNLHIGFSASDEGEVALLAALLRGRQRQHPVGEPDRQPEVGSAAAGPDAINTDEPLRRDADDLHELIGDADGASDDRRIPVELPDPGAVGDHRDCRVGPVVCLIEDPTSGRTHAEHVKIVRRGDDAVHRPGVGQRDRDLSGGIRCEAFHAAQPFTHGLIVGRRRHPDPAVGPAVAAAADRHAHQPRLIGDCRKRQHHRGVEQRERGDGHRHANRETAHYPPGEPPRVPQRAQAVAHVLPEGFESTMGHGRSFRTAMMVPPAAGPHRR
jgi:hypothetical protein